MNAFRTIVPYLRKYIWFFIGGLSALLIVDVLQLLIPLIIKRVIDDLTRGNVDDAGLFVCAMGIVGIAILIGIFRFIWRYLIFGTAHRVERNLRHQLFTHLQTVPLSFFDKVATGDIMAHATNDLTAVRMALGMALVALVDGILLSLMATGFMVHISASLTLYALLPAPLLIFSANRLSRTVHSRSLRVQEAFSQLTEKVRENFAGIRVVKSYVQEEHRLKKLNDVSNHLVEKNMALTRIWGLFFPLIMGLINLSLAIVIVFGGRQAILLNITPGDFVAFMSYLGILTWPLIATGWVMNILQRGAASMQRVNDLLETKPETVVVSPPATIDTLAGSIEFRNLTFSYGGRYPALKNINLTVHPGETVAIVGRVGCGKTTLLNLLLRLYEVDEGSLLLDGHHIRNIPLGVLRKNIGYVPQDAFLFSDSIRENVRFGSLRATEDTIVEATKMAQFHDEVRDFSHQFDTVVGEKGVILSGGQKQRVTIARALLLDAPILMFDNALSSVDTYTEELIMQQLKPLIADRTNIIVTHRISSVKDAHRIYVMDEGEIQEQGDHTSLLSLGGVYAEMFHRQLLERELEKNQATDTINYAS
jgi:ATP-binding cassette subfamily B multidrug efflux pump